MKFSVLFTVLIICSTSPLAYTQEVYPEGPTQRTSSDAPLPFAATATVLESNLTRTMLQIVIDPTDRNGLPDGREIGLGLVAVASRGVIEWSIVDAAVSSVHDLASTGSVTPSSLPDDVVRVSEPAIWRELRVVRAAVAPSYATREGDFLIRRLVVAIENRGGTGFAEKETPVRPISPMWERLYRAHVLNFDPAQVPRLEYGTGNRYIVVSRTRFENQIPQFAEWKTKQGYGVDVVTLEDLGYTNPYSREAIEATKRYIMEAYTAWSEPVEFVLLVGDMYDAVPGGSIFSKTFTELLWTPGLYERYYDTWYSLLDGPDLLSDVMVGRFPDTDVDRLDYMMEKSIGYEMDPHVEGTWQKNGIMTAMHSDYNHPTIQTKRAVRDSLADWGMNTTLLINGQANPSTLIPLINQGASFYNFRGEWCGETDWGGTFGVWDVPYVYNPNKLCIFTVLSCVSGDIYNPYPSTAEALLRLGYENPVNPIGAVGLIISQAFTWYFHNNALDQGIYRAITEEGTSLLGEMLVSGKLYAYNTTAPSDTTDVMLKEYTIYGDPSLQFQTDVPQAMTVTTSPTAVPAGQTTEITVTVARSSSGSPIPGALVCLQRNDDVYIYGYSDETGTLIVPVSPENAGNTSAIDLTVTAYNMVPLFETLEVVATARPQIPRVVAVQMNEGGGVLLTWSHVTQKITGSRFWIDHYEVYRGENAYFTVEEGEFIGKPTVNHFVDDSVLPSEEERFYRVIAVSGNGDRSAAPPSVGVIRTSLEEE